MSAPAAQQPSRGRTLALLGAAFAGGLVLLGLINDRLTARARTLWVLNQSGAPLRVEVGGQRLELPSRREPAQLSLPEGRHSVAVIDSAGGTRQVELILEGDALDRLLGGRTFVLNLEAAAPLVWETTYYGPDAPEGTTRLSLGEVLRFERVDHPFAPFPAEAPSGLHVRVGVTEGEPAALLGSLPPGRRDEGALEFAAHHLRRDPRDLALLELFVSAARRLERGALALELLRGRLAARPVEVAWHRAYQDLRRDRGELAALREDYARLSAAAPGDARLRVLSARLADDPDAALQGYRAALDLDPAEPWAHYGLAVHLFRRARYAEARDHAQRAQRGLPRVAACANLVYQVRCAQGEWPTLALELAQALERRPLDFSLLRRLLEAQVGAERPEAARESVQAYRQRIGRRAPDDPRQLALLGELTLLELRGEWEQLAAKARALKARELGERLRFTAGLLLAPSELPEPPDARRRLLRALALGAAGHESAAAARASALAALAAGTPAQQALARALTSESPDPQQLAPLALAPDDKAAALLLLAQAHPAQRAAALSLAERYAFRRLAPGPLLQRAIARLREGRQD